MLEEELSKRIIGAFFDVYRRTGFGFSEPIYANALAVEMSFCGIALRREVPIEVGLLLNFGPEGKFKRLVYSNARK